MPPDEKNIQINSTDEELLEQHTLKPQEEKKEETNSRDCNGRGFEIDWALLPLKMMYFFKFTGTAIVVPYVANFFHSLGLKRGEIATMMGVVPFIGMITRPALAFLADRFLAYFLMSHPWMTYLADSLHSVTFGLMWSTSASYVDIISSEGTKATLQAIMGGLHSNLGKGVGGLAGGMAAQALSDREAFLILSIVAFVSGIIYVLIILFNRPQNCGKCCRSHSSNDNSKLLYSPAALQVEIESEKP